MTLVPDYPQPTGNRIVDRVLRQVTDTLREHGRAILGQHPAVTNLTEVIQQAPLFTTAPGLPIASVPVPAPGPPLTRRQKRRLAQQVQPSSISASLDARQGINLQSFLGQTAQLQMAQAAKVSSLPIQGHPNYQADAVVSFKDRLYRLDIISKKWVLQQSAPTSIQPAFLTAGLNVTTDQNLGSYQVSAAAILNTVGFGVELRAWGFYTTQAASTPNLTFKVWLSPSPATNPPSGASITLISFPPVALPAASGFNWELDAVIATADLGAAGDLNAHGHLLINQGSGSNKQASVYMDKVQTVSSPFDLTSQPTFVITAAFDSQPASANTLTQTLFVAKEGL